MKKTINFRFWILDVLGGLGVLAVILDFVSVFKPKTEKEPS
jgi:hypothetical protein